MRMPPKKGKRYYRIVHRAESPTDATVAFESCSQTHSSKRKAKLRARRLQRSERRYRGERVQVTIR